MTDDIQLKSVDSHRNNQKGLKLPRGVKMIKMEGDRIIFMRYAMGRWTQLPPEEEKRLIELCR